MFKKYTIVLITALFSFSAYSNIRIDSIISLDIPGELKIDSVSYATFYYSHNEQAEYLLQKIHPEKSATNLPHDTKSLNEFYLEFADGFIKSAKESGLKVLDTCNVLIDGYKAYKITLGNNTNSEKSMELIAILLDKYIYSISYNEIVGFNEDEKSRFFKSIIISDNICQTSGKSLSERIAYKLGYYLVPFIFIGLIIYVIKLFRK